MSRARAVARIGTSIDPWRRHWREAVERLVDAFADLDAGQAKFHDAARHVISLVANEPPAPSTPIAHLDLPALLSAYERALVLWALAKARGRQFEAARLLGIRPTTLNEKMKRLGLTRGKRARDLRRDDAQEPELRRRRHTGRPHVRTDPT